MEFFSLGEIFGAVGKAKAFPGSELYQSIPVGAGESPLLIKCLHPQEWAGCAGVVPQNEALPKSSREAGEGKALYFRCIFQDLLLGDGPGSNSARGGLFFMSLLPTQPLLVMAKWPFKS